MVNQAHQRWDNMPLREILGRMRHDGCGVRAGKAELLTGIAGASSRPARRILLRERMKALCGSDKERAAAGWGFQATARVQFRVT